MENVLKDTNYQCLSDNKSIAFLVTILKIPTNKTLGPDGFIGEFY
jgi:hypothetical protein